MIFVDGAYRSDGSAPPVFHPVPPPDAAYEVNDKLPCV